MVTTITGSVPNKHVIPGPHMAYELMRKSFFFTRTGPMNSVERRIAAANKRIPKK